MRKANLLAGLAVIVIYAIPVFSQEIGQPGKGGSTTVSSESLLQRVHAMLPTFSPEDRLVLLAQLVHSAGNKHRKEALTWMDEGFVMASQTSNRMTRVNSELLMLSLLSGINSRAALEKLAAIEPVTERSKYDPRAGIATAIFPDFYHSHSGEVEKIAAVARHIGDTGTYPFGAVSNVITDLGIRNANVQAPSKEKLEAVALLVHDAIRYFRESPPSDHLNSEFANFLRPNSQFVEPELLKPILEELIARLLKPLQSPDDRIITVVSDKSEAPPIISPRHNDVLLAQLMPVVRSVDPAWEQKLRQSPEIDRLAQRIESGSGVPMMSTYTHGKPNDPAFQQLEISRLLMLSRQEPQAAVKALEQLSDPVTQAAAAASVALAFKESDPAECAQLLARAQQILGQTKTSEERLTILYQLTHTLAQMKNAEELTAAVDQTFAASNEVMAAYAAKRPELPQSRRSAPAQLSWVVQSSVRLMPEHMLTLVNDIRVPDLQADLLMAMARGLDTEEHLPKPPAAAKAVQSKQ